MSETPDGAAPAPRPFKWNRARTDCAVLLAEGELTVREIAGRLGITDRVIRSWKERPEFRSRVEALAKEYGDVAERRAIGRRARRVAVLDDYWHKLLEVAAERARDMPDVPGGKTGILVRRKRRIGQGEHAETVTEYAVDAALLRELREHARQAAQELGQWTEKHEHGGTLSIEYDLTKLSDDELDRLESLLAKAAREGAGAGPAPGADPPRPGPPNGAGGDGA